MTPEDLDAIRARLDAATPGPWEAHHCDVFAESGDRDVAETFYPSDAELIAHAPADLGALLDEVARLTAERDDVIAQRDEGRAAEEAVWCEQVERLTAERNAARAEVERLFAQCNDNLKLATSYSALLRDAEREADAAWSALAALRGVRDEWEAHFAEATADEWNRGALTLYRDLAAVLAKHAGEDA